MCGQHIPARGDGRIVWREDTFWRDKHCPSHSHDATPRCCSCSRLAPNGQEWPALQDGRVLCLQCLDTMVCDSKEAQPLYEEVRRQQGLGVLPLAAGLAAPAALPCCPPPPLTCQ